MIQGCLAGVRQCVIFKLDLAFGFHHGAWLESQRLEFARIGAFQFDLDLTFVLADKLLLKNR